MLQSATCMNMNYKRPIYCFLIPTWLGAFELILLDWTQNELSQSTLFKKIIEESGWVTSHEMQALSPEEDLDLLEDLLWVHSVVEICIKCTVSTSVKYKFALVVLWVPRQWYADVARVNWTKWCKQRGDVIPRYNPPTKRNRGRLYRDKLYS